jgi:serine/threonine-protein kinase
MSVPDHLKAALADRYALESVQGVGGMATVYVAHDLRHDRRVALKVLRPALSTLFGAERFLAEIRVTANLHHPHILQLFDSGEAGGSMYYVMPLVDGESLRQRLDREKQLSIDEAIRIAGQVAGALSHAHRHAILHRDVKPENILLQDGEVLVADFGIALGSSMADSERLTETGISVGTPTYMSPEQMTGERALDARTDIYSLGCVLYEMLAGTPPHSARTAQALMTRVLTAQPVPIAELRTTVPPHVAGAVDRALAKLPADRFAATSEFADALAGRATLHRRASATSPARLDSLGRDRLSALRGSRLWPTAALAAVLSVGVWGLFGVLNDRPPSENSAAGLPSLGPAVAVLPFRVTGAGLELQPQDMVELLTINLDGLGGLRAVSSGTVLSRWRDRVSDADSLGLTAALEVADAAGAQYALIGNVVAVGGGIRLAATAYDVASRAELGRALAEGSSESLLGLVDRLSIEIYPSLSRRAAGLPPGGLASVTTQSVPALREYLRGLAYFRLGQMDRAAPYFESAVALDSTFALAWSLLATAISWPTNPQDPAAAPAYARAIALIDRLPPRDAALLRIRDAFRTGRHWELPFAQRTARLYPDDSEIFYWLGEFIWHWGGHALIDLELGMEAFDRAIELDSAYLVAYGHSTDGAISSGELQRARELAAAYARYGGQDFQVRIRRLLLDALESSEPAAIAVASVLDSVAQPPYADLIQILPNCGSGYCPYSSDIWPRSLEVREAVLAAWVTTPGYPAVASNLLATTALVRGRVHVARGALAADPRVPTMVPAVIYHRLWTIGYPLPSADFDRELTVLTPDTVAVRNLMAGAYAADVGRWDAFERAQANARRAVALTGGASSADLSNPIARALDAYGEARRGRIPEARAELERVRTSAVAVGEGGLNSIVRWWLGEMSLTAGRSQDALRYFQTFAQDPIGQVMLGRVYETMGDATRARRAYSLALEAWADADPEFPLVEEARSALSRLGG